MMDSAGMPSMRGPPRERARAIRISDGTRVVAGRSAADYLFVTFRNKSGFDGVA
jgi:hypothetical protein